MFEDEDMNVMNLTQTKKIIRTLKYSDVKDRKLISKARVVGHELNRRKNRTGAASRERFICVT